MNRSCAVVIFNFVDFDVHKGFARRTGSLCDVKRLEDLFFLLGMCVQKVMNKNLQELREEIDKLSKFDFTEFKSILLIYMSHGEEENVLLCNDGKFNFVEESKKIFRNKTLNQKPKFITVEACKGKFDTSFIHRFDDRKAVSDDCQITAILTSSFEGFVSRLSEEGSMFIKIFTKVLRTSWNKNPVVKIFKDSKDEFNNFQCESAATLQTRLNVHNTISNFTLH